MPIPAALLSLRAALCIDGLACIAMGLALAALNEILAEPTGLSSAFLQATGALLVPLGFYIVAVAWPRTPPRYGAISVVWGNLFWVLASFGIVAFGIVEPTALGTALIVAQAAWVTGIAVWEAKLLAKAP